MDFSEFDRRMKYIDTSVKPEYITRARLFKNGKLFGYRIEYNGFDKIGNEHTLDVTRDDYIAYVSNGYIQGVRMTSSGPSGYNGFELKSLPQINLDIKYRVIAALRLKEVYVGFILQNITDTTQDIHGERIKSGKFFIERADSLKIIEHDVDCDGLRITGKTDDKDLYYPITAEEFPIFDIDVKDTSGKSYLREPYILSPFIGQIISSIKALRDSITYNIKYDVIKPLNYDERERFEEYKERLIELDVQTQGNYGNSIQEAQSMLVITDDYMNKFRINSTVENKNMGIGNISDKQPKIEQTNKNIAKASQKGIKGLFDFFKR